MSISTRIIHTPPGAADPAAWVAAEVARQLEPQHGDGSTCTYRVVHQRSPQWRQSWGGVYVPALSFVTVHGLPHDVDPETRCLAMQRASQAIAHDDASTWRQWRSDVLEASKSGGEVAVLDVLVTVHPTPCGGRRECGTVSGLYGCLSPSYHRGMAIRKAAKKKATTEKGNRVAVLVRVPRETLAAIDEWMERLNAESYGPPWSRSSIIVATLKRALDERSAKGAP